MFVFLQVSIAMAVFTVLFVPETKGKSLQEIQSMFGELEPKPTQIDTISGDMEKSWIFKNIQQNVEVFNGTFSRHRWC